MGCSTVLAPRCKLAICSIILEHEQTVPFCFRPIAPQLALGQPWPPAQSLVRLPNAFSAKRNAFSASVKSSLLSRRVRGYFRSSATNSPSPPDIRSLRLGLSSVS